MRIAGQSFPGLYLKPLPVMYHAVVNPDRASDWLDRLVVGGVIVLIALTPLAIGSVLPGARVGIELAVSALLVIWLLRSWIGELVPEWAHSREVRRLAWLFVAAAGLLAIQLTPMPPGILRLLSPAAYHVYQIAVPDWPSASDTRILTVQHSFNAVADRAIEAPSRPTRLRHTTSCDGTGSLSKWHSLTLSRPVTEACLLELIALGGAFFLVMLYPFGYSGEQISQEQFLRRVVYSIVASASLVALIGIGEWAWWNGKILWFYRPSDWRGPLTVSPRARGPFVNPDHFAFCLALVLPLAIIGALFPLSFVPRDQRPNQRLFFAGGSLLMLVAVVLSASRGGILAACSGMAAALAMAFRQARDRAPAFLQRLSTRAALLFSLLLFGFAAGSMLSLIGGPSRTGITEHIVGTNTGEFAARIAAWRSTTAMIMDFPLFGVGSGVWPEAFPRYQSPPQSLYYFFRTCENDYLQIIAEHGLVGLAIVLALVAMVLPLLRRCCKQLPSQHWPMLAGLLGALTGGLVQEFIDSSLHIPANALLFTMIFGLALRIALADPGTRQARRPKTAAPACLNAGMPLFWSFVSVSGAVVLMIAAWHQDDRLYPYDVGQAPDPVTIETNLAAHPAMAASHLTFGLILPSGADYLQRMQFAAATWLDPNDATARDLYARSLLRAGDKGEALRQISLSVYRSPFLDLHYYLAPSAIPWLLPDEQRAIARGFNLALGNNFLDAAGEAASFHELLGQYQSAAAAYVRAARLTSDAAQQVNFLLRAGHDYLEAGDYNQAKLALEAASTARPQDVRPYVELAQQIYARENNLTRASEVISEGVRHGADPYALQMALATAAEDAGNHAVAEAALLRALQYDSSFAALLNLGRVYVEEQRFERAAAVLQQAVDLNRDSAEAYTWLGRADEANYDYYAADRAYRRAVILAPSDPALNSHYRDLRQRIAQRGQQAYDSSFSARRDH